MVDIGQVRAGIREFAKRANVSGSGDDREFAAWFTHARLSWRWKPDDAREALTEVPDGGIDAIYVQENERVVYLLQTKNHASITSPTSPSEVAYLTRWAPLIMGSSSAFEAALVGLAPLTVDLLRDARQLVRVNRFGLALQFVTTGRASTNTRKRNTQEVEQADVAGGRASFELLQWADVQQTYEDYEAGVRRVPEINLPMEPGHVRLPLGGKELGICLVKGDNLAKEIERYRDIIFALNIRGHVGESNEVNAAIAASIENHDKASDFPYLNNGITMLCDSMNFVESGARKWKAVLTNAQIVNGQQTAITLSQHKGKAASVRVMLKVIEIDRSARTRDDYEAFVGQVVRATNFQTPVPLPDFHSNDWTQVELERLLHRAGHFYARKSETRRESKRKAMGLPVVTRSELADAVGGCIAESLPYRETKDVLYTNEYYDRVFDLTTPPEQLLMKTYLWRAVQAQHRGRQLPVERKRGQWLVLYSIHKDLQADLRRYSSSIIEDGRHGRKGTSLRSQLNALIVRYADAAEAFFVAMHGKQLQGRKEELPRDATNFFKSPKLHKAFSTFLVTPKGKTHVARMKTARTKFKAAISAN